MCISRMILAFVFALGLPGWAAAQSTFGGIVGTVKDPGQGAVANAQLMLINLDDRTQRDTNTDTNGAFEFINLKPGHYELAIHADGFADYKMTALQLDARQTLRADAQLKLASSSQTVEVAGDSGPVINAENATIGDSKDFQQITSLPVNYRGATTSPLAMLATVPGAQQDANGNVSIGGGLPSQVQYSVDGSSTVNIRQNGALGNMNPSTELIGEFKVTQFNNNAEFAQLGDVTISTKSGSEHFHGSVFEYAQNDTFDAEVWNSGDKPHKAFNTFGGSLGGPVAARAPAPPIASIQSRRTCSTIIFPRRIFLMPSLECKPTTCNKRRRRATQTVSISASIALSPRTNRCSSVGAGNTLTQHL
jgi:hypothetical protein